MMKKFVQWVWVCTKKYVTMPYRLTIGKRLKEKEEKRPIYKTYRLDELYKHQNKNQEYNRLDTIVRLLAIENEFDKNT